MKLENAENPQEILFGDRTRKMALSYSTGIEFRIHVEVKSFTSALKPLQTPINIFFFIDVANFAKNVILSYLF